MSKKTLLRKLYEFFVENWLLSVLVSTVPVYWFTFVEIFGSNFGLLQDGKLTGTALGVLWPLFILSFIFSFVMAMADKYNEKVKRNGQAILRVLLDNVNSIKHAKLRRFTKYINENYGKRGLDPFGVITQPQEQLENILAYIQIALSEIFGISRDDIGLSLIYRTDTNQSWQWLYSLNIENDLDLNDLLDNPNTAARQIIDGKRSSVFFPDKKVGISQREYVQGRRDLANNLTGSIICRDVSLTTHHKCIQAVLSISTYGTQLCEADDLDAIHKIADFLLPSFERRIQLELALLYIKDVMWSSAGGQQMAITSHIP